MAWLRSPLLLIAAALLSVAAAIDNWAHSDSPSANYSDLAMLLACVVAPYALLFVACRLANSSLSRFTCAFSNALAIGSAGWLHYIGYGFLYMAAPLLQCLLAFVALLIALRDHSEAAGPGSV